MDEDEDEERISLAAAVEYVMHMAGLTRLQAEQALLQQLKSGAIRATGETVTINHITGEVKTYGVCEIPLEVFQSIPAKH